MALKFDECGDCRFRRRPHICRDCDCGEQFESAEVQEITFRPEAMFQRARHPLTNDNDEPNFNPDDLIERLDREDEDREDDDDTAE